MRNSPILLLAICIALPGHGAPDAPHKGVLITRLYAASIGQEVQDPYAWCLRHSYGPNATGPKPGETLAAYAQAIGWLGLLEAVADLDGDGVNELLIQPEEASRAHPVFVFRHSKQGYTFAGNVEASLMLCPGKPGAPPPPRILVYEGCGGTSGYVRVYELRATGFHEVGTAREVGSGGGHEEGSQELERTFPPSSLLVWKKAPNSL